MTERSLPMQMTEAQVAAEFGGRSAQWLRRKIAADPAFADFPKRDRRTGLYRTSEFMAWLERDEAPAAPANRARRAGATPRSEDDWTQELVGRQL
ncbi:hypothetical protein [Ferrovibrio sp.]|uniref:hypothetical protein n=1 Tax=Ferrovibrio sp. TaxID=1917215 RepID=UPI003D0F2E9C